MGISNQENLRERERINYIPGRCHFSAVFCKGLYQFD